MKRTFWAILAGVLFTNSVGCCMIDKVFHCGGGPCGGGGCGMGGCGGGMGGCGLGGLRGADCEMGGCTDCEMGGCIDGGPPCDSCLANGGHPPVTFGCGPLPRMACGLGGRRGCRGPCIGEGPDGSSPVGAVAYPYYTHRGPRDFLARNPGGISN